MQPLTPRQREVFDCICSLIRELQCVPNCRTIGARAGLSSPGSVTYYLRVLQRKGYIALAGGRNRAIRVTVPGCPYCGTVEVPEMTAAVGRSRVAARLSRR